MSDTGRARNRGAEGLAGGDRPIDEIRIDEGAGGVVHEDEVRRPLRQRLQAPVDRILPRFASMSRRRRQARTVRFELRDGVAVEMLVVGMDDHKGHVDLRMPEERFERPREDCPTGEGAILLRQAVSRPDTTSGSDDEGGN